MNFEHFEKRVIEAEGGILKKLKVHWEQKDKLIELYEKELGDERVRRIQADANIRLTVTSHPTRLSVPGESNSSLEGTAGDDGISRGRVKRNGEGSQGRSGTDAGNQSVTATKVKENVKKPAEVTSPVPSTSGHQRLPIVPINREGLQATSSVTKREKVIIKKPPKETNGLEEIPVQYLPSEWLAETYSKRAPYFPQIGDEVVYYRQGHEMYMAEVENWKEYEISRKLRNSLPYVIFPDLEDTVAARLENIKITLNPPRLVNLRLSVMDWNTREYTGAIINVQYHDMRNVVDFIILRQIHDKYVCQRWNRGDRFRCLIDRSWWMGTIKAWRPSNARFPQSKFLCYEVVWDHQETETLCPWHLDIVPESFRYPGNGEPIAASEEELRMALYKPSPQEWPHGMQDVHCRKLSRLLEQVMGLPIADAFLTPVDINQYPDYTFSIEYPMDLSTIKARLDNRFYRRATAIQFDVEYIAMNAIEFSGVESGIAKRAKIITELCKELLSNPDLTDVNPVYHRIVNKRLREAERNVQNQPNQCDNAVPSTSTSASSVADNQKPSSSRGFQPPKIIEGNREEPKNNQGWREKCRDLLDSIYATEDASPFRTPLKSEEYPEYYRVTGTPMDLQSVKENLDFGNYTSVLDFHRDMNLIFSNSRKFNTDKRSQIYSITMRLQSLYESQVKPILTFYQRRKNVSKEGLSLVKSPKPT